MSNTDDVAAVEPARPSSPVTITREALYALVWSEPMRHLAERFGLSDQGLAKICDRFDIPRPAQGHWNKLAVGKAVQTKALPPAGAGLPAAIRLTPTVPKHKLNAETQNALAAVHAKASKLRVGERLSNPHPIIAKWVALRDADVKKREKGWDFRLNKLATAAPFSTQERRRLRILDALFKALEAETVKIVESERRQLRATRGAETIEFQLRSKLSQVQRPLNADERRWLSADGKDYALEFEETDTLVFEFKTWLPSGLKRIWQDGRKKSVEEMASDILATFLAAFPLIKVERARRVERELQRQAEERRRYEVQQQRKRESNRFRKLLEHAERWRDVERARAFLSALRGATTDPDVLVEDKSIGDWLDWADARVEADDPLRDPVGVFASLAGVDSLTYRDR